MSTQLIFPLLILLVLVVLLAFKRGYERKKTELETILDKNAGTAGCASFLGHAEGGYESTITEEEMRPGDRLDRSIY